MFSFDGLKFVYIVIDHEFFFPAWGSRHTLLFFFSPLSGYMSRKHYSKKFIKMKIAQVCRALLKRITYLANLEL